MKEVDVKGVANMSVTTITIRVKEDKVNGDTLSLSDNETGIFLVKVADILEALDLEVLKDENNS